ncbi:alpha/beta hydrolase-fold protein [Salegentibacter sp. HM20]
MKNSIVFVFLFTISLSHAQSDINIGKSHTLPSEILQEDRLLDIYLPKSYAETDKKYPVLYLLDSYYNFTQAVGTVEYLVLNKLIPEMIIVGLRNSRRIRDLTPQGFNLKQEQKDARPTRGGADKFFTFFEDELIPHIESEYRAAPYKVLVGHSLGGLFNTYTFLKKPELFEAHITISPSLWYTNELISENLDLGFELDEDLSAAFYLSIANEGGTMLGNTYRLAGQFTSYIKENDVDLRFKFEPMFEQTHGSLGLPSLFNGLQFIFEPIQYEVPSNKKEIMAEGGVDKVLEDINSHYAGLSEKYGFEINYEKALTNFGFTLLDEDEFKEDAIKVFKINLEQNPNSFEAQNFLGVAYEENEQFEQAKNNFKKALEMVKASGDPEWEFYETDYKRVNSK